MPFDIPKALRFWPTNRTKSQGQVITNLACRFSRDSREARKLFGINAKYLLFRFTAS